MVERTGSASKIDRMGTILSHLPFFKEGYYSPLRILFLSVERQEEMRKDSRDDSDILRVNVL